MKNKITDKRIRREVNTVRRWYIAGTQYHGKAHIVGDRIRTGLCGASIDTRNQVRWRDLCKSCKSTMTRIIQDADISGSI